MSTKKGDDFFKGRSLGEVMAEGLEEFGQDLQTGAKIDAKYSVRTVKSNIQVEAVTPEMVRSIRSLFNASQPVFAKFIGVSPNAVKSWEQGTTHPHTSTQRMLHFINKDPNYFRKLFDDELGIAVAEKRPAKIAKQNHGRGSAILVAKSKSTKR